MNFKIKIGIFGNVVKYKCLDIDKSLRGSGIIFRSPTTGFTIQSRLRPELSLEILYLGGTDTHKDNILCTKEFKTLKEAQDYFNLIKKTIEEHKNTHASA